MNSRRPKRLFKYLSFSDRLLQQLCAGEVHYSDPATFNDPLDCQPVVKADIPTEELKHVLGQLVVRRAGKEIDLAMNKLRLRGDKAVERRRALSQSEVQAIIGDIEYQATYPEAGDSQEYIRSALAEAMQTELRRSHDVGVLCLSERFNSPLLWSHYGQQHRGVCVEYDVSNLAADDVHKVGYGESREILASVVRAWLVEDSVDARRAIEEACLLRKSKEWGYEREWRMLGPIGLGPSRVALTAIIFGLRCPRVLQYSIVKILGGADSRTDFWQMASIGARFELKRYRVEVDELMASMPLRSVLLDFKALPEDPPPTSRGPDSTV
jgi:hypothetical protein